MAKEPTEPLPTPDRSSSQMVFDVAIDEFVSKFLVIALAMIVLGVFHHCVSEVAFSERNDLRQAFRFDRSNETLGVRVQIRASRRESDREGSDHIAILNFRRATILVATTPALFRSQRE